MGQLARGFQWLGCWAVWMVAAPYLRAQDASLEGKVLNSVTGLPVPDVQVSLEDVESDGNRPAYHTATDTAGRFLFAGVAPGTYNLRATRNGYANPSAPFREANQREAIPLLGGEARRGLELRLIPAGVISGRVLDSRGEPVPGLAVAPSRIRYDGRRRTMTGMGNDSVATSMVFTNDRGEYRLFGLPPGRFFVVAMGLADAVDDIASFRSRGEAEDVKMADAPPKDVLGKQYYPGVPDPAQAVEVRIRAGEEVFGVDIHYDYVPLVQVRGRLSVPASCPGPVSFSVRREIDARQAYPVQAAYSGGGDFELRGLAAGAWRIGATEWKPQAMGRAPNCKAREVVVQVGASGASGVALALRPPINVLGTVRFDGDQDVPFKDMRVTAESTEGHGAEAVVKSDGSFELKLEESEWSLGIEGAPANAFLKSARMDDQDVLEAGLNLSSGSPPSPLKLVLSHGAAQVEGFVVDASDRPAVGAAVVLVPEPRLRLRGSLYREAITGPDGHFTIQAISPGEYKLFAWDALEGEAYRDSGFLSAYDERGARFEVRENETKLARLRLIVR